MVPLAGLAGWLAELRSRSGSALAKARDSLAPGEELVVPRTVEVSAVVLLTLIAVFLRAWGLPGAPVGIHGDETELALEALRSIRGESIGIWTGVTLGHPAGYAHWMGLIFRIAGADVTTMRLASAIPGIAIVPVGYLLIRSLFPFRVAILTAGMVTFSVWFIIQSRIAFGGITAVFMALLAMWLLVAAMQSRRTWVAVAAGIALGLGLYTFKTFLLYYLGIWGFVLLSLALNRELRQRPQLWVFLGVSLVVGAPMLLFYATSGYVGQNLADLYQVSLGAPSTWLQIPGLALDAVLLVHLPIEGGSTDGPPSITILPVVAALFFWVGLGVCLLQIRERRYQLLLAAWLIGMTPVLFVPGAESRRYLLGIFFVLVLASVGADAVLNLLSHRVKQHLRQTVTMRIDARKVVPALAGGLAAVFLVLFAIPNLREFGTWGDSGSVRWFFNYEYHESLKFVDDLELEIPVLYYSARQSFDGSLRRFLLPGERGSDGAEEHGGSGELPPAEEITEVTLLVLLDRYLPLAEQVEGKYRNALMLTEKRGEGESLYVAYVVPAQSQEPVPDRTRDATPP